MGIYIDGMEMPETCKLCYLSEFSAGFYAYVCKPTGARIDYEMAKVSKPTRICPLIEIPEPHGRLIDADAVILEDGPYEYDDWCKWALGQYQDAPTVIPASEEGET